MEQQYWARLNNENKGPYTLKELEKLRLKPDDYIWANGFEEWVKYSTVFRAPAKVKSLTSRIFTPILIICLIILYAYLAKIINRPPTEEFQGLENSVTPDNKTEPLKQTLTKPNVITYGDEVKAKYDFVDKISEGLAVVVKDNKYGFINSRGVEVITPQFEYAGSFSNGLADVSLKYKRGYINKKGEVAIGLGKYRTTRRFSEGLAAVQTYDFRWGFINTKGELIIEPFYEDVRDFHHGRAGVAINAPIPDITGEYGFIDKSGNVVVPLVYLHIKKDYDFVKGVLSAEVMNKNGNREWIDQDGKRMMWESNIEK